MLEHDTVCLDFERMYKKGSHCHIVTGLHSAFYGFDLQCLSYIESDTPEKEKKKKKNTERQTHLLAMGKVVDHIFSTGSPTFKNLLVCARLCVKME